MLLNSSMSSRVPFEQCILPKKIEAEARHRRRLGGSTITELQANDVMATEDADMAGTY